MFQVTAIFQGAEVGYGEGEGLAYSLAECIDSIDSFYRPVLREVWFQVIGGCFAATLDLHSARAIINS